MKSSPTLLQDASDDDIFGPPRAYATTYYSATRQRPTMISAKYRQKEERRKVLKISVNKLRKIEDPENSLCRSVLINNTMKRLQRESKEEKLSQCHLKKSVVEFAKLEPDDDLSDMKKSDELMTVPVSVSVPVPEYTPIITMTPSPRKRPVDEVVEDCDVQDVLSQFYMPPTPRMLTSIDDDEELLPGGERQRDPYAPDTKRAKYEDDESQVLQLQMQHQVTVTVPVTTASSFSCGHSSIFNDLQNNVFHSLVASLET